MIIHLTSPLSDFFRYVLIGWYAAVTEFLYPAKKARYLCFITIEV